MTGLYKPASLLALALLLGGCASPQAPAEQLPPPLVTRTSDATVWTTAEAAAAAAAEAAAAARRPARREAAPARPAPPPQVAAPVAVAASAPPALQATAASDALPPRILFDFDSDEIRGDFSAAIEAHARRLLAERSLRLLVEGHADERGGAEYNLALSERRADSVLKALRHVGVEPTQLESTALGETRPAVPGYNEEAWARNRRVELKPR